MADASVDLVISNCVISLSPDKEKTFSEIARVLRPGGEMLISDIVVGKPLAFEPDDLLGLFAPERARDNATDSACPITSLSERVRSSRPARSVLRLGARVAAGHVWRPKFRASR